MVREYRYGKNKKPKLLTAPPSNFPATSYSILSNTIVKPKVMFSFMLKPLSMADSQFITQL